MALLKQGKLDAVAAAPNYHCFWHLVDFPSELLFGLFVYLEPEILLKSLMLIGNTLSFDLLPRWDSSCIVCAARSFIRVSLRLLKLCHQTCFVELREKSSSLL